MKRKNKEGEGHPLKGKSREKTPLHRKKSFHFFYWLQRLHQHDITFVYPLRTRFFYLVGFFQSTFTGQKTLQKRTDSHQSPIRIKAFVLYVQYVKHGPCPPRSYGPRKSSVPCPSEIRFAVLRNFTGQAVSNCIYRKSYGF